MRTRVYIYGSKVEIDLFPENDVEKRLIDLLGKKKTYDAKLVSDGHPGYGLSAYSRKIEILAELPDES